MKNLLPLLLLVISLSFTACSSDPIENYANKMAEIACEGERTTDMERKKELIEEHRKLEEEIKAKYKGNDKENAVKVMRLYDLYFQKLKDCLGYVPMR